MVTFGGRVTSEVSRLLSFLMRGSWQLCTAIIVSHNSKNRWWGASEALSNITGVTSGPRPQGLNPYSSLRTSGATGKPKPEVCESSCVLGSNPLDSGEGLMGLEFAVVCAPRNQAWPGPSQGRVVAVTARCLHRR